MQYCVYMSRGRIYRIYTDGFIYRRMYIHATAIENFIMGIRHVLILILICLSNIVIYIYIYIYKYVPIYKYVSMHTHSHIYHPYPHALSRTHTHTYKHTRTYTDLQTTGGRSARRVSTRNTRGYPALRRGYRELRPSLSSY